MTPALRKYCLPYVPATSVQVENVLNLLRRANRGGALLDIGSGDGRIVIGTKHSFVHHHIMISRMSRLGHPVAILLFFRCSCCKARVPLTWSRIEYLACTIFATGIVISPSIWTHQVLSERSMEIQCITLQIYCHFWRRANGLYSLLYVLVLYRSKC